MNIKPIGDRVLIEPLNIKADEIGGIYIPESAKEKPQEGKVLAIGTGVTDDEGIKKGFSVSIGDIVLLPKYGGTEIKALGKDLRIISESEILAII